MTCFFVQIFNSRYDMIFNLFAFEILSNKIMNKMAQFQYFQYFQFLKIPIGKSQKSFLQHLKIYWTTNFNNFQKHASKYQHTFKMDLLWIACIFIFVLNLLGLIYCYACQSDKLTDISYALSFLITQIGLAVYENNKNNLNIWKWILTAMVSLWAVRLGGYLLYRINQMGSDKRFDGMRESFPQIARFWFLQFLTVWLMMLPMIFFMQADLSLSDEKQSIKWNQWSKIAMTVLFTIGFIFEALADSQKFAFKTDPNNKGKFCTVGVWSMCQHPNYFGEMLMWWSLFFYCLYEMRDYEYFSVISPLWITLFLTKVSGIPLLRKQWQVRYGTNKEYLLYRQITPVLIPCSCGNSEKLAQLTEEAEDV